MSYFIDTKYLNMIGHRLPLFAPRPIKRRPVDISIVRKMTYTISVIIVMPANILGRS